MSRNYHHIKEHEQEIMRLRTKGYSGKQISEILGLTIKQYKDFITRYNRNQKKFAAGIPLKPKGRPPKDYEVTEENKIAELKYIIARKDARIKKLEMETELMRDFLSLTERK